MIVRVVETVRFRQLSPELWTLILGYMQACTEQKIEGWITGCQEEGYPKGKAHDQGRAVDFRSRDLPCPELAIGRMRVYYKKQGLQATVLFGDAEHKDHIHAHYTLAGRG